MNYSHFNAEEFAADAFFLRWVKAPDPTTDAFWETWQQQHPDKKQILEEARQFVQLMHFEQAEPSTQQVEELWNRLTASRTASKPQPIRVQAVRPLYPWQTYRKLAAGLIGFLLISVALSLYLLREQMVRYATGYGETKDIQLPDGSIVNLNANSKLTLAQNWSHTGVREVWLEGEAFFSVVHTKQDQKFIVHSSEVQIEVLGTEFNVQNRREKTQVVLNSGKVKVDWPAAPSTGTLVMQPGELVEVTANTQAFRHHKVNADNFTAWRNHELIFDKTPVHEVIQLLKDQYGLEVKLKASIAQQTFSAVLPADNAEILLQALAKSFNLQIQRKGTQITLTPE